ncbi:adenylate kinase [Actinoplanes lobatus]|uniref:Adenylate kinase n=2 Tax=Actinoplanes lobatus TaxID=113568 RepID=A0ABQ4ABT7_9ACTN|nr:adenylate kinase [Actinoplanes lobatus]GIE38443.1 adenylate kinase [Actinoplanes lobatus]
MVVAKTGAVERIVAWAAARHPPIEGRRVLAIEGRSGSGKTTLAAALADRTGSPTIHMDDLYTGWDGLLPGVTALREWILEPLAAGEPAVWRRWDWTAGAYAEEHRVPPGGWLIVEGVGTGARVLTPYLIGLVWLVCPTAERKRRALARDGATYAPHWDRWAGQEAAFHTAEQVRDRADLLIETC